VARFWLPDDLVLADELPKTSVGKLDKKVMRAQYAASPETVRAVSSPD
jgi:fatty-acyl-CoA synthase